MAASPHVEELGRLPGNVDGWLGTVQKQNQCEEYQCVKQAEQEMAKLPSTRTSPGVFERRSSRYLEVPSIKRTATYCMAYRSTTEFLPVTNSSDHAPAFRVPIILGITITSHSGPHLRLLSAARTA